ncbi:glycosyltransferase [Proteus mirabilis]|uniref:glycosyltransferase n=2 Tax=Proteus mirabilis TaxID=584 RepID=UPI001A311808|nr:glycosyltransferase family 2 protein [Proteus mirabilis]MCL8548632.1 glycosyltransferase [Proteus mirabilis]MCL8563125.1 glycosyltransferase [Proteus mirabilis]MCL8577816.1 glycosyltransferase [Proteus mirabilis]MDK6200245.1 glycosyltransferase family 2 protein [Proteus mirabilis]HCD1083802.1 glycosyltransferase family 2 protein [Proteus mirabilis]
MKKNKISVLLSIYNEIDEWVILSINSIIAQKTYNEFKIQLVIVIDNPNKHDHYKGIIDNLEKDNIEIIVVKNNINLGLASSLNKAFEYSDGNFIARLDADDIAYPERLYTQYKYYKSNSFALIGTGIDRIDEKGNYISTSTLSKNFLKLKKTLGYKAVCYHPTWFMSRDIFKKMQGYRKYPNSQDFDFISRLIAENYTISNIEKPLVMYRINTQSLSFKNSLRQRKCQYHIIKMNKNRKKYGIDNYNEQKMLDYIKTNKVINILHFNSQLLLVKALRMYNLNPCKYFLLLCSILLSPYQTKHILRMSYFKIKNYFI